MSFASFAQPPKTDSIKYRCIYIQGDLLYPALSALNRAFFYSGTYYHDYNFTLGYVFKKSIIKDFKKSIELSFYYTNNLSEWNVGTNNYNFGKSILWYITPQYKILFNKKMYNKGFYTAAGAGFCTIKNPYYNSNTIHDKSNAWNVMVSVGYRLPIKRFYFDFKLGAGSYFAYKTIFYQTYSGSLTSQEYYDNLRKSNLEPSLKKVEFNNSTIVYKYNYLGLMKAAFIPNLGINIGFTL